MEEKIILKRTNKFGKILLIFTLILLIMTTVLYTTYSVEYKKAYEPIRIFWDAYDSVKTLYEMNSEIGEDPYEWKKSQSDYLDQIYANMGRVKKLIPFIVVGASLSFVGLAVWLYIGRAKITVSDKRIVGVAEFGKHVDLPIKNIVMLQKASPKRIIISTSAGKIRFAGIEKIDEVYDTIQTLVVE